MEFGRADAIRVECNTCLHRVFFDKLRAVGHDFCFDISSSESIVGNHNSTEEVVFECDPAHFAREFFRVVFQLRKAFHIVRYVFIVERSIARLELTTFLVLTNERLPLHVERRSVWREIRSHFVCLNLHRSHEIVVWNCVDEIDITIGFDKKTHSYYLSISCFGNSRLEIEIFSVDDAVVACEESETKRSFAIGKKHEWE